MSDNQDDTIEIEIKDQNDLKQESEQDEDNVKYLFDDEAQSEPAEVEEKTPDYYDQYLRLQAEFQNYKRRTEQRMQDWRVYAAKDIISQLLPVIDDFDILFSHKQDDADAICVAGVEMIYSKLLSSLQDLGLAPIDADGKEFDPNIHEAVMAEESDEVKEGHIVKVWQRGFMYKDTLLRPAKVITAKAKQDGVHNAE